jgi:hypothetical protein
LGAGAAAAVQPAAQSGESPVATGLVNTGAAPPAGLPGALAVVLIAGLLLARRRLGARRR